VIWATATLMALSARMVSTAAFMSDEKQFRLLFIGASLFFVYSSTTAAAAAETQSDRRNFRRASDSHSVTEEKEEEQQQQPKRSSSTTTHRNANAHDIFQTVVVDHVDYDL
jgi:hypothetical protein